MNFINLTPHEINICDSAGTTVRTIPPSGDVARCAEKRTDAGTLDGVAISRAEFGDVSGLPDAAPDTAYIVSALVLAAVPDRADVFAPGPAVRDDAGRIVGCIGLSCTPAYEDKQNTPPTIEVNGEARTIVNAILCASYSGEKVEVYAEGSYVPVVIWHNNPAFETYKALAKTYDEANTEARRAAQQRAADKMFRYGGRPGTLDAGVSNKGWD